MRRPGPASLLCLLLVLATPLLAQHDASEAELKQLIATIGKVKSELEGTRKQRSQVQQSVEDTERRIRAVHRDIAATQNALSAAETRLRSLEADSAAVAALRQAQQGLIEAYLRQAWQQGEQPKLKLLLSQEDPNNTARLLRYHVYLSQARTALVSSYTSNLAQLATLSADIASERLTLQARQRTLAEQEQSLAGAQQERQQVLASLNATLAKGGAELERLEMQRVEIEVLLEELRRSVTELTLEGSDEPITARKGKLPWPVDGTIKQRFGSRHDLGDLTSEGLTFRVAAGSDVRAVHHGRVVFADWLGSSGLLVIIDHGDGYMSLYAHNQELYKAIGEWVSSGEVIAASGDTGGQRDAGLYFEFRHNGRAEDPSPWLLSRD